jgi:hypothetical protein
MDKLGDCLIFTMIDYATFSDYYAIFSDYTFQNAKPGLKNGL